MLLTGGSVDQHLQLPKSWVSEKRIAQQKKLCTPCESQDIVLLTTAATATEAKLRTVAQLV